MSKIQWTQKTWNPITGCTKVSPGCANCYAEIMSARLKAMGLPQYRSAVDDNGKWSGAITLSMSTLDKPLKRKKPTMYFVNSMSDMFHEGVTFDMAYAIWDVMKRAPQHTFQILTKRPKRMLEVVNKLFDIFGVLPNVWLGVSAENQKYANERIPFLLHTPAEIRFVSAEPLLGDIDFTEAMYGKHPRGMNFFGHTGGFGYEAMLHWVIVGGESGAKARPMRIEWARSICNQCLCAGVPFFFKQWGEWAYLQDVTEPVRVGKKVAGRILDGTTWDEMPKINGENRE